MTSIGGSRTVVDRNLLRLKNYDEYLESLTSPIDLDYLGSLRIAREVVELGYRSTGEPIDKESFEKRQRAVRDLFFPQYLPYVLDSALLDPFDELGRELKLRERANRLGVVSTIIHVRNSRRLNYEISAFVDYADRLRTEDWQPFFAGKKKLTPRKSDLAYYNWRLGKTVTNDTSNYRAIVDKKRGLCFGNVHDRILISVDPTAIMPGLATTRVRVSCPGYDNIVLYDHSVRR